MALRRSDKQASTPHRAWQRRARQLCEHVELAPGIRAAAGDDRRLAQLSLRDGFLEYIDASAYRGRRRLTATLAEQTQKVSPLAWLIELTDMDARLYWRSVLPEA
jgi:hypothetical protein